MRGPPHLPPLDNFNETRGIEQIGLKGCQQFFFEYNKNGECIFIKGLYENAFVQMF
jgi:hypothetical protein